MKRETFLQHHPKTNPSRARRPCILALLDSSEVGITPSGALFSALKPRATSPSGKKKLHHIASGGSVLRDLLCAKAVIRMVDFAVAPQMPIAASSCDRRWVVVPQGKARRL